MRELSEMLEDAKANPPAPRYTVDDVVVAGRRLRARRRATWSGLAAAAAVVAVAGVITVPRLVGATPSAGPPEVTAAAPVTAGKTDPLRYPKSPWEYAFRGYRAGEFTVNDPYLVTADFQQATVRIGDDVDEIYTDDTKKTVARSEPARNLLLTVYRPGRYDPKQFAGGEPVSVGGKPGLFQADTQIEGDRSPIGGHRGLAWQYATNGWAVLNTLIPDEAGRAGKANLVAVAAGLSGSAAYPATVAMKLREVPPGYRLDAGGRGPDPWNGGNAEGYRSSIRLVKGAASAGRLISSMTDKDDGYVKDIRINLSTYEPKRLPPDGADPAAPYCNTGNAALCYRNLPGGKYTVEIIGSGDTSPEELTQILAAIQVADVDKPATWFPLATATP
ncbi:hypothetical protein AB0M54_37970 [Actinoplanes sp. NPDC051470]|uniref:hypothetical protein n=1 Tax=Actinoplanes sp. NPDC051470 TaxID=3157224 RepID=UPI003445E9A4